MSGRAGAGSKGDNQKQPPDGGTKQAPRHHAASNGAQGVPQDKYVKPYVAGRVESLPLTDYCPLSDPQGDHYTNQSPSNGTGVPGPPRVWIEDENQGEGVGCSTWDPHWAACHQ